MTEAGVRRFPVMRSGKIVGIVSDSDILAAVAAHRWVGHSRIPTRAIAADVMRKPPEDFVPAWLHAVAPEVSLWDCAAKLAHAGVRSLPVVQEGRLIGVITDADIVGALEERGGPD
jgi:CBS domain-containing membrane protein